MTAEIKTAKQYTTKIDKLADQLHNEIAKCPEDAELSDGAVRYGEEYIDLLGEFAVVHPEGFRAFIDELSEATKEDRSESQKITTRAQFIKRLEEGLRKCYPGLVIPNYAGDLESNQEIIAWALQFNRPGTLAWMRRRFEKLVYDGLWVHMRGQADLCRTGTLADEIEDSFQQVWAWAWTNIDSFLSETSKRTGARLRAYASKNVGRTWKTLALRAKRRIVAVADIEQPIKATPSVIGDGTPQDEQKPKTTAMYCVPCGSVKPVQSEAEGSAQLACGHSRGLGLLA
jgi:hypothetical protein